MKKKTSIKPKKTVKKTNSKKAVKVVALKQSSWQKLYLWLHSKLSSLAFWK